MNGNFRNPEFVKRYEYSYFDLQTTLNANVGANNWQTKDNYPFVVDNRSEANPIDWHNSYLEVNFKLLQLDQDQDGAGIDVGTGNVNLFPQRQVDPLSLEKYKSSAMVLLFTIIQEPIKFQMFYHF